MNQRFLLPSDEGESVKEVEMEKHFAVPGFAHIICWLLRRRERNGKRRREQAEGRRQNKMQRSSHLKIMMRRSFEDDDSEDEEGTSWSKSLMPFMQGGCG
ncbi:unnamed protein product [Sphagnum jensenii]